MPICVKPGVLIGAFGFLYYPFCFEYKGGTTGASNTGREPYLEYYASQVAETIRLNAVHYDLENWKGLTASKCALFCCLNSGNPKSGKPYRITIGHYRIIGNHRYRTPLTEIVQAIYRRNFLELRKYLFLIRFYKWRHPSVSWQVNNWSRYIPWWRATIHLCGEQIQEYWYTGSGCITRWGVGGLRVLPRG